MTRSEVGYQLQNAKGRVCVRAELAWPEKKVAAVLPEGDDVREEFERRGWTVFDAADLSRHEAELRGLVEG
jgi:hypothetical protein